MQYRMTIRFVWCSNEYPRFSAETFKVVSWMDDLNKFLLRGI